LQDFGGRDGHGPRAQIFEKQAGVLRAAVFDGGGDACRDRPAGLVGDERNVLAGAHAEASLHGVLGAGHQLWVWVAKVHLLILQELAEN
jgi:hypothetical protein